MDAHPALARGQVAMLLIAVGPQPELDVPVQPEGGRVDALGARGEDHLGPGEDERAADVVLEQGLEAGRLVEAVQDQDQPPGAVGVEQQAAGRWVAGICGGHIPLEDVAPEIFEP